LPRTLYLHIGLPKTASTFLQERIFTALDNRRVVLMPQNGYFRDEEPERFAKLLFRRSETIWKDHADDLLHELFGADWLGGDWRADGRDILLSDEAIGRAASRHSLFAAHLRAMLEALRARGFSRVKLLCLVRRQDHWIASHYAQMSDRRAEASQSDFEDLVDGITDPRRERYGFGSLLDYASLHAACCEALGQENVTFCPMEWLADPAGDLRSSLARFLELEDEALDLAEDRVNARRDGGMRWKVRPLRAHGFGMLRTLKGRPQHIELEPPLSRQILDAYRRSNIELSRRTGLDLETLGYLGGRRGPSPGEDTQPAKIEAAA